MRDYRAMDQGLAKEGVYFDDGQIVGGGWWWANGKRRRKSKVKKEM